MVKARIVQVDAFTQVPFRGNPAAVCLLPADVPDAWMQAVAAEMNLSETAFLRQHRNGFSIRYFTPVFEVPLCGHATLASAHVLWEDSLVPDDAEILFQAKNGPLRAHRDAEWTCLDFPAYSAEKVELPAGLPEALGAELVSACSVQGSGYLVELASEAIVRALQPNIVLLHQGQFGPVSVTARSASASYDFVSRFFWPTGGIAEDPVTGVAHCSLGPYWAARLAKTDLVGHQVSPRGGIVRVRLRGERVDILGQAVTVMRGEIMT
jgi:predicted PhzF superfamily epimerase YddE/YHI9